MQTSRRAADRRRSPGSPAAVDARKASSSRPTARAYGTAYYTGVSNIFRFDIATKKYEVLSQRLDRIFPADAAAGRAAARLRIYRRGPDPVAHPARRREDLGTVEFLGTKVVNTHPELKTWGVGSPAKIELDQLVTQRGMYNATSA